MKKVLFIITVCGVLALGGIITSYFYFHYTDYVTYQNGIFVSKEVGSSDAAADDLY